MQTSDSPATELRDEGIVCQVDVINRELALLAKGTRVVFDVPPDCTIVLRNERVRLRLVQPRDRARVTYALRRGRPTARSIHVPATG